MHAASYCPPRFPRVCCLTATAGLAAVSALGLALLVGFVAWPWGAQVVPWEAMLGLFLACVASTGTSLGSTFVHRDPWSLLGVMNGCVAMLVGVADLFLVAMPWAAS